MDLILDEAQDDSLTLHFSDEDEPVENDDVSDFIDDSQVTK